MAGINRRRFIQATAAGAGLGLVGGSALLSVTPRDSLVAPVRAEERADTHGQGPGPAERGVFAKPLDELPSDEGPHIERIRQMAPGEWAQFDAPEPDPVWGRSYARSWGAYAFCAVPELRGAFLTGEADHGAYVGAGTYKHVDDIPIEEHPRYMRACDDYFFYDFNANRWLCIYPGTDVSDIHAHIRNGEWELNAHGHLVWTKDKDTSKAGDYVTDHLMIHAYQWLVYDSKRKRFMHWSHRDWSNRLRGVASYFHARRGTQSFQDLEAYLAERDFFGEPKADFGPMTYDLTQGTWYREPTSRERYGQGTEAANIYIPQTDEMIRFDRWGLRHYDIENHSWGGQIVSVTHPDGRDRPVVYDSKRHRTWVGPRSNVGNNRQFYYFDLEAFDSDWAQPDYTGEPPDTSWAHQAAGMFYDPVKDSLLLFHHNARELWEYDIEATRWSKLADFPAAATEFRNPQYSYFYAPHVNAYILMVGNDTSEDVRLFAYKHTDARGTE